MLCCPTFCSSTFKENLKNYVLNNNSVKEYSSSYTEAEFKKLVAIPNFCKYVVVKSITVPFCYKLSCVSHIPL